MPQIGCSSSRNRTSRAGSLFESRVCHSGVNVGCHTSSSPSAGNEETGRRRHLLPWDALIYGWECWAISICHNSNILESRACDGISRADHRVCWWGHQGTFCKARPGLALLHEPIFHIFEDAFVTFPSNRGHLIFCRAVTLKRTGPAGLR